MNIVVTAASSRIVLKSGSVLRKSKNRIRRNTPPVTRVEEWTRAETGVGAAIAAGNQLEKGTWALLVQAANRIEIVCGQRKWEPHMWIMFQWP